MIYLVGRSDSQIKCRGYRIELGEIEAAMQAVTGVQEAAVVALDAEGTEGAIICCAYLHCSGRDLPPAAIKKAARRLLPNYMLPARWIVLDSMPHNANGKTDRARIKEMFRQQAEESSAARMRQQSGSMEAHAHAQ